MLEEVFFMNGTMFYRVIGSVYIKAMALTDSSSKYLQNGDKLGTWNCHGTFTERNEFQWDFLNTFKNYRVKILM